MRIRAWILTSVIKPHRRLLLRLAVISGIVLAALFFIVGAAAGVIAQYDGRFFRNVSVGVVDVSGMTYAEGLAAVTLSVDRLEQAGLTAKIDGVDMRLALTSDHPDIANEFVRFDAGASADAAFGFGHGAWTVRVRDLLNSFRRPIRTPVIFEMKGEQIVKALREEIKDRIAEPINASFRADTSGRLSVTEETPGKDLNEDRVIDALRRQWEWGSSSPFIFALEPVEAEWTTEDLETVQPDAQTVLARAPFFIAFQTWSNEVKTSTFVTWLGVAASKGTAQLALNGSGLLASLDAMAKEIDIEPKEGKFEILNGKVSEFQIPENGRSLERDATIAQWSYDFLQGSGNRSTLIIESKHPKIGKEDVPSLGITEIIGVGESDFTGSPTNRRHNIKVGADRIHGTLIAPDEEFSLLNVLGDFGPEDGWLPELVIKENRTVPEYGGGACQFGTTMFRGAMNSGLPITRRQNHSYTVSYYFPIGTDATIYDPAPDFRFINDTGSHILLQSKMEGIKLKFEFWGTKDGRKASQTTPVLSNWTNPPPTKILETTDLNPGERKCIERPHKGVTASFDYTVRMQGGEERKANFTSKYKSWQEVCLVGVKKNSSPPK